MVDLWIYNMYCGLFTSVLFLFILCSSGLQFFSFYRSKTGNFASVSFIMSFRLNKSEQNCIVSLGVKLQKEMCDLE